MKHNGFLLLEHRVELNPAFDAVIQSAALSAWSRSSSSSSSVIISSDVEASSSYHRHAYYGTSCARVFAAALRDVTRRQPRCRIERSRRRRQLQRQRH